MKQCKVCGTLVHIDSNTCPSCGNHNFFVLDVKICPLCGKVNNVTNSFCEQCGKPFITAQGNSYVKNVKKPVKRPSVSNIQKIMTKPEPAAAEKPAEDSKDFEIERPVVKIQTSLNTEESAAERAYKDFVALKPDLVEKDDYSEVSYYVEGDAEKLPVIILPKFAKTSGKNIIVNIVVQPRLEHTKREELSAAPKSRLNTPQKEDFTQDAADEPPVPAADIFEEEFKPFSAIDEAISEEAMPFEDNETPAYEDFSKYKDANAEREEAKPCQTAVIKPARREKQKGRAKTFFKCAVLSLFSLGALASFFMLFFNSQAETLKFSGISPIVKLLRDLGVTLTVPFDGYAAYSAANVNGELSHLAQFVPYLFAAAAVLLLIISFMTLFTFKYSKRKKVLLFLLSGFTGLVELAIAASIKYVFNSGVKATLGIGLIACCALTLVYFLLLLFVYKPVKNEDD